jgi:4-hydroxy-tetrahydrodipicolinate synthase
MTGFAYPEILVAVIEAFQEGNRGHARDVFYRYLPLIRFEGQTGIGLAIRKALLRRRGLLQSAALRYPGPTLDAESLQEAEELCSWLGLPASAELARVTSAVTPTS